jgi:DNA-binding CsgD family transcriptional regulator
VDQQTERAGSMSNQQKLNEGRKARAAARRVEMQKLAAMGRTDKQIADEVGVAAQTVRHNLVRARKETFNVTDENRQATLDELMELKAEVKSHRKGDKPLPLAAVDRLIKIAEVVMRLEGTAAPTKSITAHVDADIDPEKLVGYRKFLYHTRHLSQADVNRLVFPFCDSLPPTETPAHLLEPSEDMKRGYVLEGQCEPMNS